MERFENVTVIKAANVYHDGKVTSRMVEFGNGEKKTLGVMLPGEYSFGTAEAEIMEIMSGELDVKLPNHDAWQSIKGPESFNVPENSRFELRVKSVVDYCCSYITE